MATLLEHLVPNSSSDDGQRIAYFLRANCGEVGAKLAVALESDVTPPVPATPEPAPAKRRTRKAAQ